MDLKSLVKIVKKKKELNNLDNNFVKDRIKEYLTNNNINTRELNERGKKLKLVIKEVRKLIRKVYSSFKQVKEVRSLETYKEIFIDAGKFNTLLDLGCGLSPLKYTKINKKANYYCYDIDHDYIKKINDYFKKNKIKGKAEIFDLTNPINKLPKADICFLLNVLESLEVIKRDISKEIINKVKAKIIIVSFPKKALGGRKVIKKKGRAWFRSLLKEQSYEYEIKDIGNEIFFIIK